jgi:hypothetical protein
MQPEERLAWRWVIFNEFSAAQTASTRQNLPLYYEELCHAPEAVTRRLFEFCGLPWNAQTQNFLQVSTGSQKDDYYSVVKNPLESAWKWRGQLSSEQIGRVLDVMRQSDIAQPYFEGHSWSRTDR